MRSTPSEFGSSELTFVVRTAAIHWTWPAPSQRAASSIDANVPISGTMTMTRVIEERLWRSRVTAFLLGVFAVVALVLAALGVYGVSAYAMSRRAREIGIRVALGARPAQVVSLALGKRSCPSWPAWGSVVRWLSPSGSSPAACSMASVRAIR